MRKRIIIALSLFLILFGSGCIESISEQLEFYPKSTPSATVKPIPTPTPLMQPNLRWNHMPLSVYFEPSKIEGFTPSYIQDFQKAMGVWEKITENLITFKIVNDSKSADIVVSWVSGLKTTSLDAIGNTDTTFANAFQFNVLTKAEIQLLTKYKGKRLSDIDVQNVALHELGHALGLGHSSFEESIMYPITETSSKFLKTPLKSDVQTLIEIYKIVPKSDLYISEETRVTKKTEKTIFGERYYLNAKIIILNMGLIDSKNTTFLIKVDGNVLKEDSVVQIPFGGKFSISYQNILVPKDFDTVQIIIDPKNFVSELNEEDNIMSLTLK